MNTDRPQQPDDKTRAEEAVEARRKAAADRPPTPDEERLAEKTARDLDPAAAKELEEMAKRGAAVRGEGEIVPER